jgi:thioredoxin 2
MENNSMIITCPKCGVKNRVPVLKKDDKPVCGKCRTPLSSGASSGKPIDITDNTFESEVVAFNGPVLVDCWAPWCGPCRMLSPVLEGIAADYSGRLKVVKLNTDENPKVAMKFSIQSIPTMLLFNKGQQVDRMTGALPRQEIEKRIAKVL